LFIHILHYRAVISVKGDGVEVLIQFHQAVDGTERVQSNDFIPGIFQYSGLFGTEYYQNGEKQEDIHNFFIAVIHCFSIRIVSQELK